jgi:hypothetical protein
MGEGLKMIYSIYPFNQWMTSKKIYVQHQSELHFEDPIKRKFFDYVFKKDPYRYSKRSAGKGLVFSHNGFGRAYGRLDL